MISYTVRTVGEPAIRDLGRLRQWVRDRGPLSSSKEGHPSGFVALDRLLPEGGFQKGRVTVLCGEEGSGRMTIAAALAAEHTALGRPVAWVDAGENLYPPGLAQRGVGLDRLLIVRTSDVDKAMHALEQIVESKAFEVVIASGVDDGLNPARARRIQIASEKVRAVTLMLLSPPTRLACGHLRLQLRRRKERIEVVMDNGGAIGRRAVLEAERPPPLRTAV